MVLATTGSGFISSDGMIFLLQQAVGQDYVYKDENTIENDLKLRAYHIVSPQRTTFFADIGRKMIERVMYFIRRANLVNTTSNTIPHNEGIPFNLPVSYN